MQLVTHSKVASSLVKHVRGDHRPEKNKLLPESVDLHLFFENQGPVVPVEYLAKAEEVNIITTPLETSHKMREQHIM